MAKYLKKGQYKIKNTDFLQEEEIKSADLILASMVIEHLSISKHMPCHLSSNKDCDNTPLPGPISIKKPGVSFLILRKKCILCKIEPGGKII